MIFFPENHIVREICPIFRGIGRLALPLFCFMVAEGVIHTKSFKKYILSLGIIGSAILIGQVFLYHVMNTKMDSGNIFIDLILGAICVKLLMRKNNWLKLLCLLPIGYGVASHLFYGFDWATYPIASFFPEYLRAQYGFYGIVLIIGFYLCNHLTKIYYNVLSSYGGPTYDMVQGTPQSLMIKNMFSILILVVVTLSYYVIGLITPHKFVYWDASLQNYAIISGAFLLLYNGKRGYNSNAFKYGCYLYYPAHMLIIYGIAALIFYL
jgi:hypothetical protein